METPTDSFELAQEEQRTYWQQGWEGNRDRLQKVGSHWDCFIKLLRGQINLKLTDRILDVGCGPCGMISYLDIGERYGLDPLIDYYLLKFDMAKQIRWVKGMAEDMPFQDNFFDVVISTDTLDHVANPERVLKEIKRVLKKRGLLFLTVNTYTRRVKSIRSFQRRIGLDSLIQFHTFTAQQIEQKLYEIGFKITNTWHTRVDLEHVIPGQKVVSHKQYFRRALEIRQQKGYGELLKQSINFISCFLLRVPKYEGDAMFIAVSP